MALPAAGTVRPPLGGISTVHPWVPSDPPLCTYLGGQPLQALEASLPGGDVEEED